MINNAKLKLSICVYSNITVIRENCIFYYIQEFEVASLVGFEPHVPEQKSNAFTTVPKCQLSDAVSCQRLHTLSADLCYFK